MVWNGPKWPLPCHVEIVVTVFKSLWGKDFLINQVCWLSIQPHVISFSEQFFLFLQWISLNLPKSKWYGWEASSLDSTFILQKDSQESAKGFSPLFSALLPEHQAKYEHFDHFSLSLYLYLYLSLTQIHPESRPTWFESSQLFKISTKWCLPFWNFSPKEMPLDCEEQSESDFQCSSQLRSHQRATHLTSA